MQDWHFGMQARYLEMQVRHLGMQVRHLGMQAHTSVTFMSQNVQGVTQNTDFAPFSVHLGQKTAQFRPSYPPRLRKHHPQCGGIREMKIENKYNQWTKTYLTMKLPK